MLRNLVLLLLPILLYYCLFLALEPNNYFGLRQTTLSGQPIGMLRAYEQDPQTSVIVGNSRLAHFDMQLVEKVAGHPYGNIAFGGASLRESLDVLEWWLEKYPQIDEIVFGLTFYTLNANYDTDRFDSIRRSLDNPVAYLTSLSFNAEALLNLYYVATGQQLGGGEAEKRALSEYTYTNPNTGEELPYPAVMVDYAENSVAPQTQGWRLNETQLERLLALIEGCAEKGIRFVVVFPPVHDSIMDLVVRRYVDEEAMAGALQRLHAGSALVLDYEFENRPPLADDQFYDGFHLEYDRGLPVWTEMLFTDIRRAAERK